jgi:hypothetical protein
MRFTWAFYDDIEPLKIVLASLNYHDITIDYNHDNFVYLIYHDSYKQFKIKIPNTLAIEITDRRIRIVTTKYYFENKNDISELRICFIKQCHRLYDTFHLTLLNAILLFCLALSIQQYWKLLLVLGLLNTLKCVSINRTIMKYKNEIIL